MIRIGTQGWNYAAWVGHFYPPGTRSTEFLSMYARAFHTVEVDSTFYAVPDARVVRGWNERTPPDFTFALKMPKTVTHELRLRDAGGLVTDFLDRARELGTKLGPVLLQLGADFGPNEWGALEDFLPDLPGDVRFALEVRDRGWLRDDVQPRLLELLTHYNVALALTDARWIPRDTMLDLATRPTADFLYLRWLGPDRDITDYSHIQFDRSAEEEQWADVMKHVANTIEVFGYFNNHFAGHSPASARALQRLMRQETVDPESLRTQRSLF